jgi:glyoxylase-like metal-dependent hydrolase (beta-lactamase superfamily II)
MRISRRMLLAGGLAAGALPRPILAATLTAGELRIDTLSDGMLVLPADFILGGMPRDELAAILARHGMDPAAPQLTPPCNVTLLRDGTNTVLFDAGAGPDFMPSAGRLAEALAAIDLDPEAVTHVVFTHGHPDHLWGVLDDFDEPVFANAVHRMGAAEHTYWTDPATLETIGPARQAFAAGAARRLAALEVETFGDGDEPVPGVRAVLTPGHTPGHMAFRAGEVLIAGDAIGNHHVAFARPDWESGSDQDAPLAAATRAALLASIADQGLTLVGFHLPAGGIGRVVPGADGARWRFEPERG